MVSNGLAMNVSLKLKRRRRATNIAIHVSVLVVTGATQVTPLTHTVMAMKVATNAIIVIKDATKGQIGI